MKSSKKLPLILVILIIVIVIAILGIFMCGSYQRDKTPNTPTKTELVKISKKASKHEKNAEKKERIVSVKEAVNAFYQAVDMKYGHIDGIYRIVLDEHADKYTYTINGYRFNGKKAITYSAETPALKSEFDLTSQTIKKDPDIDSKKEFLSSHKAINLKKVYAISRQTLSSLAYSQVPGAQQYKYEYSDSTCTITAIKEKETKNYIVDTDIGIVIVNLNTRKISSVDSQQYAGTTTKYDKDTRSEVD